MKVFKIIFLGVLVLALAPSALAVKRAPFPNSNPLQPIPRNVQPNITGNVNTDSIQQEQLPSEPAIQEEPAPTTTQETTNSGWNATLVVFGMLGLAVVAGFFLKFKSKNN